jgi:signal peptidase I
MKSFPKGSKTRIFLATLSLVLFFGLCGSVLLHERLWVIQGVSMVPTFQDGQRLVIVRSSGTPARGDIVLVNAPKLDQQTPKVLLKRVIGIPGDRLQFNPGERVFLLNGVPLVEPYVNGVPRYSVTRDLILGPDQYFIMGDNRNYSLDSRDMGPVVRHQVRHIISSYFVF